MNFILKRIKPFDRVVILFCLLTGIYILFGYRQLQNIYIHILIRIIFLLIIFLLIKADNSNNKILQFFRNFYPLLLLAFFYSETDYYNNLIFENFDPILVKIENLLFGTQLSLQFSNLIPNQWFSELMHFGYFSYYLIIFGIPLLFYLKARNEFEKTMFILVLSFCLYYLTFIVFPSIGPQFYFPIEQKAVPDGYVFERIMNIIIAVAETKTGAFPSSHVGMVIIFLIIIAQHFKKHLYALIPLTTILILSTVYIKAHYAIDIIAGIITGVLFYMISNRIYNDISDKSANK